MNYDSRPRRAKAFFESREQGKDLNKSAARIITVSGTIFPCVQELKGGRKSNYKIASMSGVQYFFLGCENWNEVLSSHCWQEVKVVGHLDPITMILTPQKVFPRGPAEEPAAKAKPWREGGVVRRILGRINELIIIPAALLAVMVF